MTNPQEVITALFVATDEHQWNTVEQIFNDEVVLDYSSMTGDPAARLSPADITTAWKGILPGFRYTHHQLGNFLVSVKIDKADVKCYGTATHYLEDEGGNVWTVVGTYDFSLTRSGDSWRVDSMKFNFKYQDGNTALPRKAIEQAKK